MKLNKRIVGTYIKKWKRLLKLDAWTIFVEIEKKQGEGDHEDTEAHVVVNRVTNSATVTIFEPMIDDEHNLELAVAHELTHIVLNEMETMLRTTQYEGLVTDVLESSIDKICDAFKGLLDNT